MLALGADWCNAARGFMFALGCIQSQTCHTDRCPTGVATQDPLRQRALVVADKAERVYHFHHTTLHALAEVVAAAGLSHPNELPPRHFSKRVSPVSGRELRADLPLPRARRTAQRDRRSALRDAGWRAPRASRPLPDQSTIA